MSQVQTHKLLYFKCKYVLPIKSSIVSVEAGLPVSTRRLETTEYVVLFTVRLLQDKLMRSTA